MNTLLLAPAIFASHGGIERILRLYVRALGELTPRGGVLQPVVLNDGKPDPALWTPYTSPALAAPVVCRRSKLLCVAQTLRLARRADRIVCGHTNLLRLAHLARRLRPALEIWTIAHGIEVWRDFASAEHRALCASDRILCVSDFTRRQVLHRCPSLAESQLIVQPNALDPKFEPAPTAGNGFEPGLMLAVSRLAAAEDYKGIDHLIAALPAIRASVPDARLRVVGDGDDRPRLQALAVQQGVAEAVEFTGRVSDDALRAHFAACQIFALPSAGEGFGLVYLEALAHGKPCVAAEAGGAPEIVTPEVGLLAPPADVPQLAAACVEALSRPWNPAMLRARAHAFSYEVFRSRLARVVLPA